MVSNNLPLPPRSGGRSPAGGITNNYSADKIADERLASRSTRITMCFRAFDACRTNPYEKYGVNSYQNSFKSQIYPVMLDRVILKIGVETN